MYAIIRIDGQESTRSSLRAARQQGAQPKPLGGGTARASDQGEPRSQTGAEPGRTSSYCSPRSSSALGEKGRNREEGEVKSNHGPVSAEELADLGGYLKKIERDLP